MKKSKKIIALFLVLVMCIGLFPAVALAADDESNLKSFNVVAFGSKNATGYGLSDYGQATRNGKWSTVFAGGDDSFGVLDNAASASYINSIETLLGTTLFGIRDVRVKNLCFENMRVDELRALLQPDYLTLAAQKGERGDTFLSKNITAYRSWFNDPINAEKLDNMSLEQYTRKAVQDADVIILDFAMENFYSYLNERLQAVFGLGDFDPADYSETASDLESQLDFDVPAVEQTIKTLLKLYVPESAVLPIEKIVEALAYCYSDFRVNFSKDIRLIRSLNASAKIIVVGAYNTMSGLRLNFNGDFIDMSALWISLMSLINNYITTADNSALYFYANVSGGVNTLFQDLSTAVSVKGVYPDYANMLIGQVMDLEYPGKGTTYLQTAKQLEDLMAQKAAMEANDTFNTPEYTRVCNLINALNTETFKKLKAEADTIVEAYISASKIPTLDATGVLEIIKAGEGAVNAAIKNAALSYDTASDAQKALLHINARFMIGDGMGCCPSEPGCEKIYEVIRSAIIKVLPANTDKEGTIIGAAGGGFASILQIFKTPILQTISDLFNNFSFDNVFQAIRDRVSNWIVTIFPRNNA